MNLHPVSNGGVFDGQWLRPRLRPLVMIFQTSEQRKVAVTFVIRLKILSALAAFLALKTSDVKASVGSNTTLSDPRNSEDPARYWVFTVPRADVGNNQSLD